MKRVSDMDFTAMVAFVTVGDEGGFRAAAMTLGMTSAGVSKAVARLEAQLGVMLVARTTRQVRLTDAGSLFYERCKIILADLDSATREAVESSPVPQGKLVVSVSRTFGRLRVLPVVADYIKQYPKVEVEVRLTDRLVDLVEEGVDLAVRIGNLPDSSLVATRISQTGFVLCASPEYLAKAGKPTNPDDLRNHSAVRYVTPDTGIRFAYRFQVDGVDTTTSIPGRLTVDDGEAAVIAATRSSGLVMVNDYVAEQYLADGSLVRLMREFEVAPVPISIVHLPVRSPSPALRTLTDILRRRLKGRH